ncbi:TIGR01459 family HAD-type hydrolase [Aliirhizobium smilacinae]|nr:TIGR01459 family HAD-type hydrolase [Rhizobium smilacinae]
MRKNAFSSLILLGGLREVIADYDGAIVDLWGVVHDGVTASSKAITALRHLRDLGKTVCLLSNAPRRSDVVIQSLAEMGVDRDLYRSLVTSGDTAILALSGPPLSEILGRHFFHIGPDFLQPLVAQTNLVLSKTLSGSDFILCTGTDRAESIDDLVPLLAEARSRDLAMVCVNPDLTVHIGDREVLCAGAVAACYQGMGGLVHYFGKPYPDVYELAFKAMDLDARRVIAIGDAFRTDIKGAASQDVDSILITSGIHRADIGPDGNGRPDMAAVAQLAARHAAVPTFVMDRFQW